MPPANTSANGDIQVFAIMIVLTILLALVPFIPGLRSIPRWTRLYRLIWREHYREVERGGGARAAAAAHRLTTPSNPRDTSPATPPVPGLVCVFARSSRREARSGTLVSLDRTIPPIHDDPGGPSVLTSSRGMKKAVVAVALGTVAVLSAACSSSSSSSTTTAAPASTTTTTTTPPIPTTVIPTQPANSAIAATVPASIHSTGTLTVALDATYPPNEFLAPDGTTIVGMDADLSNAIAQTMGLKAKLVNATFDTIIPGLVAGKYDMGASSFTDTKARQKVVDFVDYFSAGESFYVKTGSPLITSLQALCGKTVAVESGTTEEADAKTQAAKCTATGKGKVTVLSFGTQTEANVAVSSGRADAGFADSPVAGLHRGHLERRVPEQRRPHRRRPLRARPAQEQRAHVAGPGGGQPADLQRRLHPDPHQVGPAGGGRHHGHGQRRQQLSVVSDRRAEP